VNLRLKQTRKTGMLTPDNREKRPVGITSPSNSASEKGIVDLV
jgi:hypothetical protein